jgi:antitoxin (DNA-binding transcriptional repressor) of toxin-antitoxin stability system
MDLISKSEFKAHALEVLREIEKSGQSRVITDRGKPTLEIRKLRMKETPPLELLRGSVLKYDGACDPVDDEEWENA